MSVTFTPTDSKNYTTATANLKINVKKANPKITWNNPTDISYGTPLSGTQLNPTASVPGSFVYTPPSGKILSIGQQKQLTTIFTPTDNVNYTTASATALINVINLIGLFKQAPKSTFQGNLVIYKLYYQNFGQINIKNVVLTDTLPENVEFVSASKGGAYNNSTGTITWDIGSLAREVMVPRT